MRWRRGARAGCSRWSVCWSSPARCCVLRLSPSAATGTLVGSGSDAGRATTVAHARFGDDAVYVLVRGDLPRLVLTSDLNRLLGLEGCLSGNVPEGVEPPGGASGPCGALARSKPVRVVYGPGTFINSSVTELTKQLQAQTRARAAQAERAQRGGAAARAVAGALGGRGAAARPRGREARVRAVRARAAGAQRQVRAQPDAARRSSTTRTSSTSSCSTRRAGRASRRRASRTCSRRRTSALVSVRLKAGLSDAERARAVALVRAAVRMPEWRLQGGALRRDGRAGAGGRSDRRAGGLDAAAAARRGGRDGAGAGAAVPRAAAAAAAGDRAGRVRDRVRRAVAAGAAADDGVDRGAAGAARARRRLRDPVPGAASRRCACRRAGDRDRGAGHGASAS